MNLKQFFSLELPKVTFEEPERRLIQEAIAKVEKGTNCEVVPIIISHVSNYVILRLFLGVLITLGIFAFVFQIAYEVPAIRSWLRWSYVIPAALMTTVSAFRLLGKNPHVLLPLIRISARELARRVHSRIDFLVALHKLQAEHQEAIIVAFCLFEEYARVWGDKKVREYIEGYDWCMALQPFLRATFKNPMDVILAFTKAIENIGKILKSRYPVKAGGKKTLPDNLILWTP